MKVELKSGVVLSKEGTAVLATIPHWTPEGPVRFQIGNVLSGVFHPVPRSTFPLSAEVLNALAKLVEAK